MRKKILITFTLLTFSRTAVAHNRLPVAESGGGTMDVFLDLNHLEPLLRTFVDSRVTDLTELGPLVPDPGGLAVFGVALIFLGLLRRYIAS